MKIEIGMKIEIIISWYSSWIGISDRDLFSELLLSFPEHSVFLYKSSKSRSKARITKSEGYHVSSLHLDEFRFQHVVKLNYDSHDISSATDVIKI